MNYKSTSIYGCIILASLILSLAIACLTHIDASLAALCASSLIFLIWGKKARPVCRRLLQANIFILFMWLIVPITTPGVPILSLFNLDFTLEGFRLCALLSLKANAIILLLLSSLGNMTMYETGIGLSALHCPSKLIWLFLLMEQNVYALKKEWTRLHEAAKLRGFSLVFSLRVYRVLGALMGLLLIRAHKRGETTYEAMLLAGYSGEFAFKHHGVPGLNGILIVCCAIFLGTIFWLVNLFS